MQDLDRGPLIIRLMYNSVELDYSLHALTFFYETEYLRCFLRFVFSIQLTNALLKKNCMLIIY